MTRPLRWAAALAALSIVAVQMGRMMPTPLVAAVLASLTAPGIVITFYEILRALDGPPDARTRRSVLLAVVLLAIPFVVLLSFVRHLGVEVPWSR